METQIRIHRSQTCLYEVYILTVCLMKGASARLMLVSPENHHIHFALRYGFKASNNKAKYDALIVGLCLAKEM